MRATTCEDHKSPMWKATIWAAHVLHTLTRWSRLRAQVIWVVIPTRYVASDKRTVSRAMIFEFVVSQSSSSRRECIHTCQVTQATITGDPHGGCLLAQYQYYGLGWAPSTVRCVAGLSLPFSVANEQLWLAAGAVLHIRPIVLCTLHCGNFSGQGDPWTVSVLVLVNFK